MAPGRISTTADMWSADTTKAAFLGVTGHWIQVEKEVWEMRSEVIGFRSVPGDHGGENLGRYYVGVCDRTGITSKVSIFFLSCIRKFGKVRFSNMTFMSSS
jgi:hypothetical protein